MKKKLIIVIAALLVCACGISAALILSAPEENYTSMKERVEAVYDFRHTSHLELAQYKYENITNTAEVIAIARASDPLTRENSAITEAYNERNKKDKIYIEDCYSVRQTEILENIKGDVDYILVHQYCGMLPNGKVEGDDPCFPMIEDDVYALFLRKKEYTDSIYLPIAVDNGLLNLSYLKLNAHTELAAMLAADRYGSELPQEIREAFLKSKHPRSRLLDSVYNAVFVDEKYTWNTLYLSTPYTIEGMEIPLEYIIIDEEYFFRIDRSYLGYYNGTW